MTEAVIGAASIAARLASLGLVQQHGEAEDEALGVHDAPCTPAAIFIEYDGSARAVTLHAIWRAGPFMRLRGFCHLRGALREFRSDRIESLIDLSTGEAPDDATAWLSEHALSGAAPLQALLPELTVLAFLAKSDGHLDADEVEAIVDFVLVASDIPVADLDDVRRKVARLTPEPVRLVQCVGEIVKDSARLARLKRAMRRVVDADRDVPVDEQVAASHILGLVERSLTYQSARAAGRQRAIEALAAENAIRSALGLPLWTR